MLDASNILGSHDVLFITLDSLRYDVAVESLARGMTPTLAGVLPGGAWEQRETPGNFTYSAHHAFFCGFLPTPPREARQPRLFATRFAGSETTSANSLVFDAPNIVAGFAEAGYHTLCIGGVGFFNNENPTGRVLPSMFQESYWSEETSVTSKTSTAAQIQKAESVLRRLPPHKRIFLFINVSATHQPTCIFDPKGTTQDTKETQGHALAYVDTQLSLLFDNMRKRAPVLTIICADHGTMLGEDGLFGHRINHPTVLTVPYAEFILKRSVYANN